ncbi:F0F1 ATP synthase subunit A [Fusibacter bizertensis]|jgi:ATP synthase F0 subcomplex A subunit|uniref:ATP synthase subunit a n=1 Tax=Fusibacter bizertensis TaxID=1488331 RepID=A0ABT6NDU1_9FIRM|nr:F0F1 ATP synthase subunit A [Fusibacter bizertensis]MDH8678551.1 F0F1 ATP synthase subunit A [Fusibacter bizertensis]
MNLVGSEGFGPRIVFTLRDLPFVGDIPVSETVTVTWMIIFVLLVFSIVATRNMKREAKGLQLVVEQIVSVVNNLTKQNMGERNYMWAPFVGTLLFFIGISNIIGLLGFRPPTGDLNTTMCLSITTFVLTQFFGVKSKGLGGYGKGFLQPMPFLLPLNIIGELANPVSLGFRLFGNITAGIIIMSLLYGALGSLTDSLFGLAVPLFQVGVPAVFHIYFDMFAGLLQSFIFTMLTMVFISGAME